MVVLGRFYGGKWKECAEPCLVSKHSRRTFMKMGMEEIEYCRELSSIAILGASKANLMENSIPFKGLYLHQDFFPMSISIGKNTNKMWRWKASLEFVDRQYYIRSRP